MHLRFNIDLPFPLSNLGDYRANLPPQLLAKPTPAQLAKMANMTWLDIIIAIVKRLQSLTSKPVEDEVVSPLTVHVCRHEEGLPCVQSVSVDDLSTEVL